MRAVSHIDALAVSIVLVGACSSFDSTRSAGAPDAGADAREPDASVIEDAAAPDADAGIRCERTAPFTSIRPVDGVNSPAEESFPRLSADERVIYFQRSSASGIVILRASRAAAGDAFDTPIPVDGLPTDSRHPFVTADELEIVFVQRSGSERFSLWHARREKADEPFGAAAPHPADEAPIGRHTPFVSSNGAELFFSQVISTTDYDLYRAPLAADGGVGTPEPLATLNSRSFDSEAVLSPDLLSLYFYSERSAPGVAKGSIWAAHRDTPTGPFRAPMRVDELVVDGGYTSPGSVSPDGCRLYFYSNKDAATGSDLYVAERSPR